MIERTILRLLTRLLLRGFEEPKKDMSPGEWEAAMRDISVSEPFNKYMGFLIANLIRRHLYVKDMNEGSWYLGQISALRKIQKDAERWKSNRA
jgi:hypothetical protein